MIKQFIRHNGGADAEAAVFKNIIFASRDENSCKGDVYYVSDKDEGAFDIIRTLPLKSGDAVLFERGSVFRLNEMLWLKPGVYYGAYGAGEKPVFLGSLRNYADAGIWQKAGSGPLWVTNLKGEQRASLMVFDGETAFGNWCYTKDDLREDGDFFHDHANGLFYFYFSVGNPGAVFNQIEIATTGIAMRASFIDGMTVDNICFKYFAQGAFLFGECNDITIRNCVMGWQGGKIFEIRDGKPIRYGNAAEFWYQCGNITVQNCYLYQIYDAALTFQGYGDAGPIFRDIVFENNLIEYCSMNIEYWAGMPNDATPPHIENIRYAGNIIRFCGYGFGGIQRVDKEGQALLLGWNRKYTDITGFVIENNVLDCSNGFYIYMFGPKEQQGIVLKNNAYYQKAPDVTHPYTDIISGRDTKARGQADFESAIALFDENPKLVKWLK